MRLSLFLALAVAAVSSSDIGWAAQLGALKSVAKGDMAALVASPNRAPEPTTKIWDANGRLVTLAELKARDKIVVVDLWATWCSGCVQEMPTFAKLQAAFPDRIMIVPISMDLPKDREKARAFMARFPQLPFYQNTTDHWPPAITTALEPKIKSLPDALIYDRNGKEIARLAGQTANWNGTNALAVFNYLLKHPSHGG
jgi:thiol-disulfide isomerase/thioredoxin